MRNLVVLIGLSLLNSCIVPASPKRDYYQLLEIKNSNYYDGIGYVYKNDKYIINLWVFSTLWKSIYFSTNFPIKDSVKLIKQNKEIIYLKKIDKLTLDKLPYRVYYNDSVNVYTNKIKKNDNEWYIKNGRKYYDTIKIEIERKEYTFALQNEYHFNK